MTAAEAPSQTDESLAASLEALASPVRLAILRALRRPTSVTDIRVAGGAGSDGRPMSRQAVTWHLNQLLDAGLVLRHSREGRTQRFVIDHQRLFAILEEMASLGKLRPVDLMAVEEARTLTGDTGSRPPEVTGPRLVLVHGRDDGAVFSLVRDHPDGWVIGRGEDADILLDYDPFVSTRHARVRRRGAVLEVEDLGSSNGTSVNGRPIREGEPRPIAPGDVLTVGRSRFVFQSDVT